jgi:hypothetical protein
MLISDAIFEVLLRIQDQELSVSISRPTVRVYLNEALQYVKLLAEKSDYLFYVRGQSFSGTSFAYPSDYKSTIYLFVPAATDGQARIASNRQYVTVNNNSYETGTTANPTARLTLTGCALTPTSDGTHYYLWTFPEQNDETVDLQTLIPWAYEELVILKTVEYILFRHFLLPQSKITELSQESEAMKSAYTSLYKKWMPELAYKEATPSPA